jgi:hypothetical protein
VSGTLAAHSNKVHYRDTTNCRGASGGGMRAIGGLIVLALTAPLGGCFSLTAQKTVPEWAMAGQGQSAEQPRSRVSRAAAQRRVAEERTGSFETGNAAMSTDRERTVARPAERATRAAPTNFSPEWYAQEKAADEQLRRSMNICRGC